MISKALVVEQNNQNKGPSPFYFIFFRALPLPLGPWQCQEVLVGM